MRKVILTVGLKHGGFLFLGLKKQKGCVCLQKYIQALESVTVCVISHDRAFLDAVTQETIVFREKQLTYHSGPPQNFQASQQNERVDRVP